MRSGPSRHSPVLMLAAGVAGLALGCSGDDGAREARPATPARAAAQPSTGTGTISTELARGVPLDITRERFDSIVVERPARATEQHQARSRTEIDKLPPEAVKRLEEEFGRAEGGAVTVPAQTFTCLLYKSEEPKKFAWQFCFGEAGRLEYVSTVPPL